MPRDNLISKQFYPPRSPVEGMDGGTKAKWLRQHRGLVIECNDAFGDDWTCHLFNMTKTTLLHLVNTTPRQRGNVDRNTKMDMLSLRIDIIHEELAEVKRNQRELERLFSEFVQTTSSQISKALIIPLIRNVLRFEGELPEVIDPLEIDRLLEAAGRNNPMR
jgi:hypothetical protein